MKHPFQRIVWAVDPYAEDLELQKKVLDTAITLAGDSDFEVEPVSIIHWDQRFFTGSGAEAIKSARAKIEHLLTGYNRKRVLPATVLLQDDLSLNHAVKQLVTHAHDTNAELIAVGTQARAGVTRFLLGSFAETLVLSSSIPTMLVSPKTEPTLAFEKIYFPTDLSEKSFEVFPRVVSLARLIGASITVYHRLEYLPKAGPHFITPAMLHPGILEDELARRKTEAKKFVAVADESKVKVELILQKDGKGTVESLVELSESPSSIIAMVSQTKAIESALLGSTTRQVIRRAHSPVWVIHPSHKGKKGT